MSSKVTKKCIDNLPTFFSLFDASSNSRTITIFIYPNTGYITFFFKATHFIFFFSTICKTRQGVRTKRQKEKYSKGDSFRSNVHILHTHRSIFLFYKNWNSIRVFRVMGNNPCNKKIGNNKVCVCIRAKKWSFFVVFFL